MTTSTPLPVRFVTAASLFDGHDASINIMRRVLQQKGAEVIHLGHNRSVDAVVEAAVEEDAHAIAISSYQGGHVEYFKYMVDQLEKFGASHIQVFGGGGGTITNEEIQTLHNAGVERVYSVEDGRTLGLEGMIDDMLARARHPLVDGSESIPHLTQAAPREIARALSVIEFLHDEDSPRLEELRQALKERCAGNSCPVLGITGTGGAGKSSLTDELVRRFLDRCPERSIAVLSVDPSRRRTGGALLGDRIRMNAVHGPRVYMRSMATRRAHRSTAHAVGDSLLALQGAGFDLVILETAGIGQSDSEVVDLANVSLYVMTPEFGAPSQLEKIDMLDFADIIAINKSDKRGASDALRDVRKQYQRNQAKFDTDPKDLPVFLTAANRFADEGVDDLFTALVKRVAEQSSKEWVTESISEGAAKVPSVVPSERVRYLSEISEVIRNHRRKTERQSEIASRADGLARTLKEFGDQVPDLATDYSADDLVDSNIDSTVLILRQRYHELTNDLSPKLRKSIARWKQTAAAYSEDEFHYQVRGKDIRVPANSQTLSGTKVPKVALPRTNDWAELVRWFQMENLPGE
ncbi:MAG: methylmalonyl-CoA mutase family protein, partial [Planctomycetes bacterium]|nr:methylmalonyl-CoA mutase family protein [Planctomycetota bacterium]